MAHVNASNTFEALAREWHANWKEDKTEKHAAAILSRFETDVFPFIGGLPVGSVTPLMILEVVKKAEARAAYDVARRIKQTCGQIFRYGVATGRAERDPTHDIRDAMRPYKMEHFAALDLEFGNGLMHGLQTLGRKSIDSIDAAGRAHCRPDADQCQQSNKNRLRHESFQGWH